MFHVGEQVQPDHTQNKYQHIIRQYRPEFNAHTHIYFTNAAGKATC
jgi:hypothetical protein